MKTILRLMCLLLLAGLTSSLNAAAIVDVGNDQPTITTATINDYVAPAVLSNDDSPSLQTAVLSASLAGNLAQNLNQAFQCAEQNSQEVMAVSICEQAAPSFIATKEKKCEKDGSAVSFQKSDNFPEIEGGWREFISLGNFGNFDVKN